MSTALGRHLTDPNGNFCRLSLVQGAEVSPDASLPPLPEAPAAPIDLLSTILANRLAYKPGERDAVVLAHEVTTESADGQAELFTSSLVQVSPITGRKSSGRADLPLDSTATRKPPPWQRPSES